jgi:hypothetical protein
VATAVEAGVVGEGGEEQLEQLEQLGDEVELECEWVRQHDVGAVGERPVGGVGLRARIGQLGLEPAPRALGPLVGPGNDQAAAGEHPPDRRHRRHRPASAVPPLQVVVDGVCADVDPQVGQLLAERHDLPRQVAGTRVPWPATVTSNPGHNRRGVLVKPSGWDRLTGEV